MKTLLKILSFAGLGLTIFPSFLVFNGVITIQTHYHLMFAGMILWFVTSPFWIKSEKTE